MFHVAAFQNNDRETNTEQSFQRNSGPAVLVTLVLATIGECHVSSSSQLSYRWCTVPTCAELSDLHGHVTS